MYYIGGHKLPLNTVTVPVESAIAPYMNPTEDNYAYVTHRPEAVTHEEKEALKYQQCCCLPITNEHHELLITSNRILMRHEWKTYKFGHYNKPPPTLHTYYCIISPLMNITATRVEETYPVIMGAICCPGVMCCPPTSLASHRFQPVPGTSIRLTESLRPFRTHFENIVDNPQLHAAVTAVSTYILTKSSSTSYGMDDELNEAESGTKTSDVNVKLNKK